MWSTIMIPHAERSIRVRVRGKIASRPFSQEAGAIQSSASSFCDPYGELKVL